MTNAVYKIGDLAREFDVTLRTLRFYEDRGLVTPARSGTTRLYSQHDRERLRIALFCKRIGLSLDEIRDILDLQEQGSTGNVPEKMHQIYTSQLHALEKQQIETSQTIADLQNRIAEIDGELKH